MVNPDSKCEICGKRIGLHLLVDLMKCQGKSWVRLVTMETNENGQFTPWNVFWSIIFLILVLAILSHYGLI